MATVTNTSGGHTPEGIPADLVRHQVEEICTSRGFARSERLKCFLRFVTDKQITGHSDEIREEIIGVMVFAKTENYDRGADSIVRTEANVLRTKLADYYKENPDDSVRITIPKGGYVPRFELRNEGPLNSDHNAMQETTAAPTIESAPTETTSASLSPDQNHRLLDILRPPLWLVVVLVALGALLGTLLFWSLFINRPPRPRAESIKKRITSYRGNELFPAASPDGQQVAFAWNAQSETAYHIYVKFVDEVGQPIQLTRGSGDDISPTWSPDGHFIAFVRLAASDKGGVFVIPSLGGRERKLIPLRPPTAEVPNRDRYFDWPPESRGRYLAWSPDGKRIAIVDHQNQSFTLTIVSTETGELQHLPMPPLSTIGDIDPEFSPDGHWISFQRITSVEVADLYIMSTQGGKPERLTFDDRRIDGHTWTPDSKAIIFSSERGGGPRQLWSISIRNRGLKAIPSTENATLPVISNRFSRLIYCEYLNADYDIWATKITSKMSPERLISTSQADVNPQYSPDGKTVAYASDSSGHFEIWLYDLDSRTSRPLTAFGGPHTGSPRWSPDGTSIAFDSRPNGNADIYVVSALGGKPTRITNSPAEDVVPSWSRDGRVIYFASNRSGRFEVWQYDIETHLERQITSGGGFAALQDVDGVIYFTKTRSSPELWSLSHGSTPQPTPLRPWHWSAWTLTKNGIVFVTAPPVSRQSQLWLWNPKTGGLSLLRRLETPIEAYGLGLSVSPQGDSLVYSRADYRGSDLIMIDHFQP